MSRFNGTPAENGRARKHKALKNQGFMREVVGRGNLNWFRIYLIYIQIAG
jgi:hypothetical protein